MCARVFTLIESFVGINYFFCRWRRMRRRHGVRFGRTSVLCESGIEALATALERRGAQINLMSPFLQCGHESLQLPGRPFVQGVDFSVKRCCPILSFLLFSR